MAFMQLPPFWRCTWEAYLNLLYHSTSTTGLQVLLAVCPWCTYEISLDMSTIKVHRSRLCSKERWLNVNIGIVKANLFSLSRSSFAVLCYFYISICYLLDLKEDDDTGMKKVEKLVQDLPFANFNTLKFIRYFIIPRTIKWDLLLWACCWLKVIETLRLSQQLLVPFTCCFQVPFFSSKEVLVLVLINFLLTYDSQAARDL